jgi:nucleoside-diphosphate-sugar epimerase
MIGPARNTMQPVAIDDAIAGVLKCAVTDGIEGRIYNIAGPEILTIRSMCETIAQAMGTTLPRLSVPLAAAIPVARISELLFPVLGMRPPLTRKKLEFFLVNNSYSIERARRELGWNPTITFEQGARQIAAELKQSSRMAGAA